MGSYSFHLVCFHMILLGPVTLSHCSSVLVDAPCLINSDDAKASGFLSFYLNFSVFLELMGCWQVISLWETPGLHSKSPYRATLTPVKICFVLQSQLNPAASCPHVKLTLGSAKSLWLTLCLCKVSFEEFLFPRMFAAIISFSSSIEPFFHYPFPHTYSIQCGSF